ncbi:radical SAM protein [Clostridium sp. 19966]|uniref:radical SAM protein n=1 Tax=Clostridium sp. 19966 TaxID=2768166 RepID=UPI0028DE91A0|nr:radical SAM protein [Clostridium sp. 19966]MDT8718319.1 radical SAM protein [Clostridium sp. 19966]
MKVALIDVDGHNFPNLVLMKISSYHKSLGDTVSWYEPFNAVINPYDRVYMAKVFTFTEDYQYPIYAKEIVKGGSGYDLENKLSYEIEHQYPDYQLYGITDTAYGFLTRGCPRGCDFCIVGKKEGRCSYKVADLKEFWNGQKEIKLLDPNLLAAPEHIELLEQLVESSAWVDITQGFDIRLTNPKNIELIKQMKVKMLHFAWDKEKDEKDILEKLKQFKKLTGFNHRKMGVYMLTNFDTTFEYDLYRVYKLKELGYDPYVMIYDKMNAPRNIRLLQRWVNNKIIFRSGTAETFEQYNEKIG